MVCSRSVKYLGKDSSVKSLLFDKLYQITKDEKYAEDLYNQFNTDYFKREVFGDFTSINSETEDLFLNRVDENNEPLLIYNSDIDKYYYIDLYGQKVYEPQQQGLEMFFTKEDLDMLVNTMALKYFQTLNYDFENNNAVIKLNNISIQDIVEQFIDTKIKEFQQSGDFIK